VGSYRDGRVRRTVGGSKEVFKHSLSCIIQCLHLPQTATGVRRLPRCHTKKMSGSRLKQPDLFITIDNGDASQTTVNMQSTSRRASVGRPRRISTARTRGRQTGGLCGTEDRHSRLRRRRRRVNNCFRRRRRRRVTKKIQVRIAPWWGTCSIGSPTRG
jgi:hypothetical protein